MINLSLASRHKNGDVYMYGHVALKYVDAADVDQYCGKEFAAKFMFRPKNVLELPCICCLYFGLLIH